MQLTTLGLTFGLTIANPTLNLFPAATTAAPSTTPTPSTAPTPGTTTPTITNPLQCTPTPVPYFGLIYPTECQAYHCLSTQPRTACTETYDPLLAAPPSGSHVGHPTSVVQTYGWTTVTRPWDWATGAEQCTVEQVPYFGGRLRNGCGAVGVLESDTLAAGPTGVARSGGG